MSHSRYIRHARSRAWASFVILAFAVAALWFPATASPSDSQSEPLPTAAVAAGDLNVVGSTNLGGNGLNGDIAVVGDTAIVGAGLVTDTGDHTERYNPGLCVTVSVKVVDISDPADPAVASEIPLPAGVAAAEVDALRVNTPSFTGDLAAIALDDGPSHTGPTACANSPAFVERGIEYYDVSNPSSPQFLGRYQADANSVPENAPPCGPRPEGDSVRCATGQHAVDLVKLANGTVLSLTTQPATYLADKASGPLRIVDVTNPAAPVEVGSWPAPANIPSLFSDNGCRPVAVAHSATFTSGGSRISIAFQDDGIINLNTSTPASPSEIGRLNYVGDARRQEGNAAYVTETKIGGRRISLLSEEDWAGPETILRVDSPASIAGEKLACQGHFTLFDKEGDAQIYSRPNHRIEAEIVYGGRGCPDRVSGGVPVAADPWMADPSGKIVVLDRAKIAATQPNIAAAGCRNDLKLRRAQEAGALAAMIARVVASPFASGPHAVAPGGMPHSVPGGAPLTIPIVELDTPDGDDLRTTLCPAIDGDGNCTGGQAVNGALIDRPGQWGGLRVVDNTNPASPKLIQSLHSETNDQFPPPDLGIYAPHFTDAVKHRVFVAWNSDGLRAYNMSNPADSIEVGSFVPDPTADPTGWIPPGTYVTGVAVAGEHILTTDMNSGLYVLEMPDFPHERSVSLKLSGHLKATGKIAVADKFNACRKDVPVVLQRRKGGRWTKVATSRTNNRGEYSKELRRDRPSVYRAKIAQARKAADKHDVCRAATSRRVAHRHR